MLSGLEGVLKSFWMIVDDVKRKPYDLLDFTRNQFERDYLEFDVNIHDLEISLQASGPSCPCCKLCVRCASHSAALQQAGIWKFLFISCSSASLQSNLPAFVPLRRLEHP